MRSLAAWPVRSLAGVYARQTILLPMLFAALVGFFLLLEFVVSLVSTGPRDVLAGIPSQERMFGVPNGVGLLKLLIIPVSMALASAALLVSLGWPLRRASLRPSWSLAMGALAAASLVAAGAYLAFSGILGNSVSYDEHMVHRADLETGSLVLLAAFFLSVTIAGLLNWRALAAVLVIWLAAAGVFGFLDTKSIDGLLLFPRSQLVETPGNFAALVRGIQQTDGAPIGQPVGSTTTEASTLSDKSLLSEVTALQDLPRRNAPVFRVTGAAHTRYLRTSTGDLYSGGTWSRLDPATVTLEKNDFVPDALGPLAEQIHMPTADALHEFVERILVTPIEGADTLAAGVLPVSKNLQSVDTPATYFPFSETLAVSSDVSRYETESTLPVFALSHKIDAVPVADPTYLQLPDALPLRVHKLAEQVGGGASPYLKARLLQVYLQEEYAFGLANTGEEMQSPTGQDPVDWFLFDRRVGASGNFSSAFVVLARAAGVPARAVSGWVVATQEDTQTVHRNQTHQWAEIVLDGLGWVTIDPFPKDAFSDIDVDHSWETALEEMSTSASPEIRAAAPALWGDSDNPEALLQLFKSINNAKDPTVRHAAQTALGTLALDRFTGMLLKHEDPLVRGAVAYGLKALAVPEASNALINALAVDQDARVRVAAADALAILGKGSAEEPLLHALATDQDAAVRAASARALGALETEWTAGPMLSALASDPAPEVRAEVALALGGIGNSIALLPLLDARSGDASAEVRAASASVLAAWDFGALLAVLENEEGLAHRIAAVQLMGEGGFPEAITPLGTVLGDSSKQIREAARDALEEIGEVIWLESGGGVITYQGNLAFLPHITAESGEFSPPTPVFRVRGSAHTSLLRVAAGDIYQEGQWIPDGQEALTAGVNGIGFRSDDIRPLPAPDSGSSDYINLSGIGSRQLILSGYLPTSLHAEAFSIPVIYRVQSHTVIAEGPPARYGWEATIYDYSPEQLNAAETWAAAHGFPYTQLPYGAWIERARALATEITAGHRTPYAKAKAIEQYLIDGYTYQLSSSSAGTTPQGQDPIATFLFDSREGASGDFSSAFVILARSIGIPARVVSGWAVAETRSSQIVYTNQAHQWAEAPFEGLGWVTFDPTPEGAPSRVPENETSDSTIEDEFTAYEGQGAEVTRLENGGALVKLDGEAFIYPWTTTRQTADSPSIPLFEVVGAAHTGYLRLAVGDMYEDGGWIQLDPVDIPYTAGSDLPGEIRERYDTLTGGFDTVPADRLASESLFGFRDNALRIVSNRIRMFPAEGSDKLPYGAMPTSLDVQGKNLDGVFHPFSATFSREIAAASYFWTSDVSLFSGERYAAAAPVADAAYTLLPHDLPGRIRQLAQQITGSHDSPYAKAEALERYLKSQYAYGFADSIPEGASPASRDPVDWFLFDTRQGTSGQFSSAFVVLARSVGIPARVVGGLVISPKSARQTVYADQAHQWAEIALEGVGWVRFDPTAAGGAPSRVSGEPPVPRLVESSDIDKQDVSPPSGTVTNITDWPAETRRQTPFVVGGTVLTLDGRSVSGMTVEIYINETKEHGGTKIGATTSRSGRFQAEAQLPLNMEMGGYQLLARAVGNKRFNESWSDPDITVFSGNRIKLTGPSEVGLNAIATFNGRVIEDAGLGLAQRELKVTFDGNRTSSVLTDQGGEFTFSATFSQLGQHWVEMELKGGELLLDNTLRLNFEVILPTKIAVYAPDSVAMGEELLVSGELRETGGPPITRGQVELTIRGDGYEHLNTVDVGENGRFEYRHSSFENPGPYTLTGRFAGGEFVRPTAKELAFRVLQPTVLALDGPAIVRHGEIFRLAGTLRDIDGNPVPNSAVQTLGRESLLLTTDAEGRFAWDVQATFDESVARDPHESELMVGAVFNDTQRHASSTATLDLAVGLPRILVETLNPVTRGSEATIRGTVLLGTRPVPGVELTVGPGGVARSNAVGTFMHTYLVSGDEPLGTTDLVITAPALDASTTARLVVKSAANLTVTRRGTARPGGTVSLQAALLDDTGTGVPGAALRSSQGVDAITDESGRATLELAVPGKEDLQGSFVELSYAGDNLRAPLSIAYFWESSITPNGFNWLLWVGAPGLIALTLAAAYVGRRIKVTPLTALMGLRSASAGPVPTPHAAEEVEDAEDGEDASEREDGEDAEDNTSPDPQPVQLRIAFQKEAEDLPDVWGAGEEVRITVSVTDERGGVLAGAIVKVSVGDDAPFQPTVDADGAFTFGWGGTEPGDHAVSVEFTGDDGLTTSKSRSLRIVDFREEIVRLYDVFLDWAKEKSAGVSEISTARDVEALLLTEGLPIPQKALSELIVRFEEADYSEHPIARRHYEAMYRAWSAVMGAGR